MTDKPVETTRRHFAGLADYAERQGAPESDFLAAGWQAQVVQHSDPQTRKLRPALQFQTPTGARWRFVDGDPDLSKYTSPKGYKRSWYRLPEALALATESGRPLTIVNGEAGTVVAQHHGIPATALTGGEGGAIPPELLTELLNSHTGQILIALDCDPAGRYGASKRARQLIDAGRAVTAVDLQLGDKGDIADFCKLHGLDSAARLLTLPVIPPAEPKPIFKPRESAAPASDGAINWEAERAYWWLQVVIPAIEQRSTARRGKHFQCINPAHDDRNPSARISTQRDPDGLYICTCGAPSRETVAGWLGLDFKEWFKAEHAPLLPKSTRQRRQGVDYVNDALRNGKQTQGENPRPWPPQLTPVTLEKPSATQTVSERYLSTTVDIPDGDLAIRSPLGSGKTRWVIDEINQHQPRRVLYLTYLQALTENAAERLNKGVSGTPFEHYLSIPSDYSLGSIDRLVVSLNSLYRCAGADSYDLVVIDEIEQVIPALWDGTMKADEPARAYRALVDTLKTAKQVVVLDAHLSRESIGFLQGIERAPLMIENTRRPARPALRLHQYESSLIDSARRCADQNPDLPIVITTTSRKAARKFRRLFTRLFGETAVRLIYGWNSHERESRDFLKRINEELPKLRVLIASPTVGTGVDVTCAIAGVFGYFPGQHLPPTAMMQQIARYRNARTFAAMVPHAERHAPESAEDLLELTRYKIRQTRKLAGIEQDINLAQAELTRLWASYTAQHNRLTNRPLATFAALAEAEGFSLEWVAGRAESTQSDLKAANEQQQAIDDNLTLTLDPISQEDFEIRRVSGKLLENDHLAHLRWKIEDVTGQDMSADLLERYRSSGNRAALIRLTTYLHGGQIDAARVDRLETNKLPFKRSFSTLQIAFFDGLVKAAFGRDGLSSTEEIPADELAGRVTPYLDANRQTIRALDNDRLDLSESPIALFRRMLKRFSISLKYRRARCDGKLTYTYFIDQESLGVKLADAAKRWAALQKRLFQSAGKIPDIRDLEHRTRLTPPGEGWRLMPTGEPSPAPRRHYTNPYSKPISAGANP
ncbi:MAG: hypothetical protein K8L97_33560 [Anaerolineae bacterium]|nr:hypothetical protein [Anaerolineae bacterium]